MKKAISTLLAMALLCGMLCMPASALSESEIAAGLNGDTVWSDTELKPYSASVQVRRWTLTGTDENGVRTASKSPAAAEELQGYELPQGVTLTAGPANDLCYVSIYSDPDKDGVYDQHLLRLRSGADIEMLPASQTGPLSTDASTQYAIGYSWRGGVNAFTSRTARGGYRLIDSTALTQRYGAGTLIELVHSNEKDSEFYLLTGETAAAPQDKLESYNICITKNGFRSSKWAMPSVERAGAVKLIPEALDMYHQFDLRGNITRGEFAAVALYLYAAMSGTDVAALTPKGDFPFVDVDARDSNRRNIELAYSLGLVSGISGSNRFQADDPVTREQAAAMLASVYKKLGGEIPAASQLTYSDSSTVGGWAKDAVSFLSAQGILSGLAGNKLAPKGNTTCEQALVMALKMYGTLK